MNELNLKGLLTRMEALNNRQMEAVLKVNGPVLILAGAGSGKTRVLTHRIAHMIEECGINPFNVMAITFTNKAAGEMRERVTKQVAFGSEQIWVSTFHSSCVRILRRYAQRIGYESNFTIYDTDDQKTLMKEICKKLQIDTKQVKERTLLGAISSAKDELISPEEFLKDSYGDYNRERIAKVYAQYQEALHKNNAMDFDDLIVKTVELFRTCGDVLDSYQERFKYIMVDEYQDTNTAQFEFLRLLSLKYRNLCVVGDDDQSIYKFRGANIRNILDFEKIFPDALVIKLEQNYRSTQTILDAANAVIRNNKGRKEKALWTSNGDGEVIHFKQVPSGYDEADFIVSDIAKKKREIIVDYKDCAILYRTNAQARLLEEQFVRRGIPYDVVGGTNFYSRREIKDLLAYLKTIDNASDDLSVKRIINIPKRGIGLTTLDKIQFYADAHGMRFFEALKEADRIDGLGKTALKIQGFVNSIQVYRSKIQTYGLEGLILDILETTEYIKMLEADDEEEAKVRIENIDELVTKIVSYEQEQLEEDKRATLSEFLEEVALVSAIDKVSDDNNRVLLMTLHSAKGLEFSHVYLAGLEDGVFPGYMSVTADDPLEMEEERRLAYVGITRAKEDLTITCAKSRMIRGETQVFPVSRFVKEIPQSLLDHKIDEKKPKEFMDYPFTQEKKQIFEQKPYQAQIKPRATKPSSRTNVEVKPFMAGGLGALGNSGAIQKGINVVSMEPDYTIGDAVKHIKYGVGIVEKMESGPRDYQVTVQFKEHGTKIMYAGFAKLVKVSES